MADKITVCYLACDGARKARSFTTIKGAAKFAQEWVGPTPEIGTGYAVSPDGIGRVTVDGATLAELFPAVECDCHGTGVVYTGTGYRQCGCGAEPSNEDRAVYLGPF